MTMNEGILLMSHLDFYRHLTRRKPGSIVFTSSYLTPLPLDRHSVVADLGCGFGHRATWIARSRCCQVHARRIDDQVQGRQRGQLV